VNNSGSSLDGGFGLQVVHTIVSEIAAARTKSDLFCDLLRSAGAFSIIDKSKQKPTNAMRDQTIHIRESSVSDAVSAR